MREKRPDAISWFLTDPDVFPVFYRAYAPLRAILGDALPGNGRFEVPANFTQRYPKRKGGRGDAEFTYERLSELYHILGLVMARHPDGKAVLNLPPKRRIKTIAGAGPGGVRAAECGDSGLGEEKASTHVMEMFHDAGRAKIPEAKRVVERYAREGCKFLLFYHHRDIGAAMEDALQGAGLRYVKINGETSQEDRRENVSDFQKNEKYKCAMLSITAAGMGLTLTAASRVLFVELYWTPNALIQAEDRCHRIGQTKPVTIEYLCAPGTYDEKMYTKLEAKYEATTHILDNAPATLNIRSDRSPASIVTPAPQIEGRVEPVDDGRGLPSRPMLNEGSDEEREGALGSRAASSESGRFAERRAEPATPDQSETRRNASKVTASTEEPRASKDSPISATENSPPPGTKDRSSSRSSPGGEDQQAQSREVDGSMRSNDGNNHAGERSPTVNGGATCEEAAEDAAASGDAIHEDVEPAASSDKSWVSSLCSWLKGSDSSDGKFFHELVEDAGVRACCPGPGGYDWSTEDVVSKSHELAWELSAERAKVNASELFRIAVDLGLGDPNFLPLLLAISRVGGTAHFCCSPSVSAANLSQEKRAAYKDRDEKIKQDANLIMTAETCQDALDANRGKGTFDPKKAPEAANVLRSDAPFCLMFTGGSREEKVAVVTHDMFFHEFENYRKVTNQPKEGPHHVMCGPSLFWPAAVLGQISVAIALGGV